MPGAECREASLSQRLREMQAVGVYVAARPGELQGPGCRRRQRSRSGSGSCSCFRQPAGISGFHAVRDHHGCTSALTTAGLGAFIQKTNAGLHQGSMLASQALEAALPESVAGLMDIVAAHAAAGPERGYAVTQLLCVAAQCVVRAAAHISPAPFVHVCRSCVLLSGGLGHRAHH